MDSIVIRAEGLSKQYTIGRREAPYDTFREMVLRQVTASLRWIQNRGNNQANGSRIWALKDVSFEVKPGEVVGIIGRNGAGKTTLLKILSRITDPTKGFAEIRGRVASLLSVGTGFHPELTGRENIYLNGTILGMRKGEIAHKFDEIVSFAEIEKFIDTPVKHYSSGMYVRLAFAIAAHLDPEILLVDEVLAVGDVQFQKKCLGKMHDVASEGRTILFVSHNMAAVQRLCSRVIWLDGGAILKEGATNEVARHYLQYGLKNNGERIWDDIPTAPGDEVVRLRAIRALDVTGAVRTDFTVREPLTLEMEFWVIKEGYVLDAAFDLYNETGTALFSTVDNLDSPWKGKPRPPGIYKERCIIPGDFFNDAEISVTFGVVSNVFEKVHAQIIDAIGFTVIDTMDPSGVRGNYHRPWPPVAVRPRLHWTVERAPLDKKISLINDSSR